MNQTRRSFISAFSLIAISSFFKKSFGSPLIDTTNSIQGFYPGSIPAAVLRLCEANDASLRGLGFIREIKKVLFSASRIKLLVPYVQYAGQKQVNRHYLLFVKDENWQFKGQINGYEFLGIQHLMQKEAISNAYFPQLVEIKEGRKYFVSENASYQIHTRLNKDGIGIEVHVNGQCTVIPG